MKTKILTIIGLLSAGCLMAQTQKGNGILSGNVAVNYNRQTYSDPNTVTTTTWTPAFTISAGRFWTDNWLAGLSVSSASTLARQRLEANPNQTHPANTVSISASPFVRRYWSFNSVYLFAGIGLSVSVNNTKQDFLDNTGQVVEPGQQTSSFGVSPRLEAGVNYFLTNRLGLQVVASASSLPLDAASLNAGLVYWTGPGRTAEPQEERSNLQTDRGRWIVEGGFSVNSQKNSQSGTASVGEYQLAYKIYSFSPSIGYFFKKNNLIGLSIPVAYLTNRTEASGVPVTDNDVWTYGISPYFQHYWTSTRLTPYTRVNAGYIRYNSGSLGGSNISAGLTFGLAYMAGQRFIIETSVANASISHLATDRSVDTGKNKSLNASVSAGLTGNFAIRYVL